MFGMRSRATGLIAALRVRTLNPSPSDDSPPGDGFVNGGWQNGSADDDSAAIVPFFPRLFPRPAGTILAPYYQGSGALDGPHFRVGYQGYDGIAVFNLMQGSESDSTIGRPTRMRPPIIPRRNATPLGVRNAINFVQSMPYETWTPIIPPPVSRR